MSTIIQRLALFCINQSETRIRLFQPIRDEYYLFCSFSATLEEQSITHPHDVSFVNCCHFVSPVLLSIFESIVSHSSAGVLCDQFDGLHHTINNLVFYARVLSLRVLSDRYNINIIIQSSEALNWFTGSYIGVQVKLFPQSKIQRPENKK